MTEGPDSRHLILMNGFVRPCPEMELLERAQIYSPFSHSFSHGCPPRRMIQRNKPLPRSLLSPGGPQRGPPATREHIMAQDHDNNEDGVSRRHALAWVMGAGAGVQWAVAGGAATRFSLFGRAEAASALAQTKPTIPVIVKDRTSFYWQTVFAGARKAGQDLGVN